MKYTVLYLRRQYYFLHLTQLSPSVLISGVQCLCKELTEKFDEKQMDLQAAKMSLDTQTISPQETQGDMRNDLHDELGLMLQVKVEITKAEISIFQERMVT